jgi:hypothetical protein
MGVSMAGMLAPSLSAVPTGVWALIFCASTVWFGWRAAVDSEGEGIDGRALGQHLPHLLMSAAMVYMWIVVDWSSSMGATHGTALLNMTGSSAGRWPLPTIVLAILLFADGALTFGVNLHQRAPRLSCSGMAMAHVDEHSFMRGEPHLESSAGWDNPPCSAPTNGAPANGAPTSGALTPRAVIVCQLVMSLVMGYMVVSLL